MDLAELIYLIFSIFCVLLFLWFYFLALIGSGLQGKAFMAVTSVISYLTITRDIQAWGFLIGFYPLAIYVFVIGGIEWFRR